MAMRLTEQAYLVLLALADEPRHGYGVVQEVGALSGGTVRLGAGTLYGILDRLVAAGYAEGSGEVVVDGRLRRYYRLTPEGHDALTAETARLSALARRADRLLGGVPRPGIA
ncbi:PadR family transcriptional regulator [Cellulomonas sp. PS-H5]|uniref:PadR family transcriptional regulator n=1 Tax=Cellulomonas sp. PS-H5 TaxID=2820400 RepID=UPI001C4FCFF6|nr:PadR family transcriptional regulator [Cellulomonas sp. PS-H5]MBW0253976.1 PadR family transcriptional regulator [Cellulomonas sp. PS-H5]